MVYVADETSDIIHEASWNILPSIIATVFVLECVDDLQI
jgi:hypothetical protein